MAGNKIKLQQKLAGSTILEVIVAMVIMIMVFGIALMIYANVVRLSLSVQKLRAQAILQDMLINAVPEEGDSRQIGSDAEFRIEQEIKPVAYEPGLYMLTLTAYDNNRQRLAQVQQIKIYEEASK